MNFRCPAEWQSRFGDPGLVRCEVRDLVGNFYTFLGFFRGVELVYQKKIRMFFPNVVFCFEVDSIGRSCVFEDICIFWGFAVESVNIMHVVMWMKIAGVGFVQSCFMMFHVLSRSCKNKRIVMGCLLKF